MSFKDQYLDSSDSLYGESGRESNRESDKDLSQTEIKPSFALVKKSSNNDLNEGIINN